MNNNNYKKVLCIDSSIVNTLDPYIIWYQSKPDDGFQFPQRQYEKDGFSGFNCGVSHDPISPDWVEKKSAKIETFIRRVPKNEHVKSISDLKKYGLYDTESSTVEEDVDFFDVITHIAVCDDRLGILTSILSKEADKYKLIINLENTKTKLEKQYINTIDKLYVSVLFGSSLLILMIIDKFANF